MQAKVRGGSLGGRNLRDALLAQYVLRPVSVCLSVRPSQAGIVPQVKCRITQTTPHNSPGTLSSDLDVIPMESLQTGTHSAGVEDKCQVCLTE